MMKVMRTVFGLCLLAGAMVLIMSAASPQGLGRGQNPVIKRMGTYRAETFAGFAEFRVQEVEFDDFGALKLKGEEPYDLLLNVNHITSVHRYEDVKKTDYSCLMYTTHWKHPKLIRQEYKDVLRSMEKAMDEYSK
jgi:hypothetical protein